MIIFLYTTNQHQKWDNFYFEHFPQNSILTLDRPHRIRRAPVDQVTHRACRALDRGQRGQVLILRVEESVQNKNCPIFDAD